jgi:hypothetical protein
MHLNIPFAVLLVLSSFTPFGTGQTASPFQFTGKPGPHAVGLHVVEQYDYTRTYRSETDILGKPYQGERAEAPITRGDDAVPLPKLSAHAILSVGRFRNGPLKNFGISNG